MSIYMYIHTYIHICMYTPHRQKSILGVCSLPLGSAVPGYKRIDFTIAICSPISEQKWELVHHDYNFISSYIFKKKYNIMLR